MEMCYDGALVMPSSYAVMDAEEMTYVEGGVSWKTAKQWGKYALYTVVTWFAGKVLDKLFESAFAACAAWIKGALETAILTVMCYPDKVAAIAAGVVILGAAGYGVYLKGKNKGYWK